MPRDREPVFSFDRAIVRRAGRSVTRGLRAIDVGDPDFERLCTEHDAYVATLEAAGVTVIVLPALESYPDAIFVEDPALVFPGFAVVLRSRAESRRGEAAELLPVLQQHFDSVVELRTPGFVDGGDVLVTGREVLIGLSDRTNRDGAIALIECLAAMGLRGRIVATPAGVLHLKSDCALLDQGTVLSTPRLASTGIFDDFAVVPTPRGEAAAANALRVNDVVMVGDRFPRTIELLDSLGFELKPLAVAEIGKLDAGLSCLSLRWRSA